LWPAAPVLRDGPPAAAIRSCTGWATALALAAAVDGAAATAGIALALGRDR
jgi:hypothetical protein